MRILSVSLVLLLAVFSANKALGFATVVNAVRGGDTIMFTSNVEGADVYLDGLKVGNAVGGSFQYKVERTGNPRTFTFKKDGYKDVTVTLGTKFDMMFWGNALLGGFIGSSVDSITSQNNIRQYTPNQFYIEMTRE